MNSKVPDLHTGLTSLGAALLHRADLPQRCEAAELGYFNNILKQKCSNIRWNDNYNFALIRSHATFHVAHGYVPLLAPIPIFVFEPALASVNHVSQEAAPPAGKIVRVLSLGKGRMHGQHGQS